MKLPKNIIEKMIEEREERNPSDYIDMPGVLINIALDNLRSLLPKEEPTQHRSILLGWDKSVEDNGCDVYGYQKDGRFYVTNVEYRVQEEPTQEPKEIEILE